MNFLGWFWFIVLALLVGGWAALVAYTDHLLTQGRYDQALKFISLVFISRLTRSRLRADTLIAAGRYEEAAGVLRDVFRRVRRSRVTKSARVKRYFDAEELGNLLMETGRFEEAHRFFLYAAQLYPYNSGWATGMAEVALRQGVPPEDALAHAEKALNLFQRGAERVTNRSQLGAILATKAWALAACGREVEAREAIDAALQSSVRKTKAPLAQVHYKSGMSLLALSDRGGAVDYFARGAELDPAGRWGRLCADALRQQKSSSAS
ncbi:MAG TPA: hypothetical protein VGS10_11260 [Terracidiphilus sp.]|nr:hypothetical protein [Terracidiphilus sp.]